MLRQRLALATAAGALCAVLLAAPAPAAARVTVTVEVAYGGVVVGGIGIFIAFSGSWEVPLALRDLPTALFEISPGRTRLGVPIPSLRAGSGADAALAPEELQIDLVRWRF